MYTIKKALTMKLFDLYVNGCFIMRSSKEDVEAFVRKNVQPLGLERSE